MSPKETSLDRTVYSLAGACEHCGSKYDRPEVVCACGALLVNGLNPGSVIGGRYRYLATIGNGGMGLIVKAYDPGDDCDVALKLLLRNKHVGEVTRFMQECRATDILSHPCIIKVKEYGTTDDGFPFMAMEYLPGDDLGTIISRKGALDMPEALEIFAQLCDTMSYAHSQGVVHRDLKPSNIMLPANADHKRKIKLVDFGIAKVVYPDGSSANTNLTQTGQIVGSPIYMSPEQALGKKIDFRTDIYSAGCVLYHALTGAPPIQGESAIETLFKHVNETPVSMKEASLGKTFPLALERLVAKAIKKDPADRYQTFQEMKQDLLAAGEESAVAQPTAGHGQRQPGKTFPRLLLASAIAMTCLSLAMLAVKVWHNSSLHPPANQPNLSVSTAPAQSTTGDASGKALNQRDDDERHSVLVDAADQAVGNGANVLVDSAEIGSSTTVTLGEPMVDDRTIKYLLQRIQETHAKIRVLNLNKSSITDKSLQLLADAHLPLTQLYVNKTKITGAGLQSIARITTLEILDLSHDSAIAPAAFTCLGNLKRLTNLNMFAVVRLPCKDQDFAFLPQLKLLNTLELSYNPGLPARIFRGGERLYRLTDLRCATGKLTDQSLADIGNIGALEHLELLDNQFTDDGVANLDGLTGLTFLRIGGNQLTGKSFPALVKMRNLTKLILEQSPQISASEIAALRNLMPQCNISLYKAPAKFPKITRRS